MKGLFLTDAYMAVKVCKGFFFLDILFIAMGIFGGENNFFVLYPCFISGVFPMSIIAYGERDKWDAYAATLPCTRAQFVSSKYLIGLAGSSATAVVVSAGRAIRAACGGTFLPGEQLAATAALLLIGMIAPALLFPFLFRFGAERGRILFYVIIAAVSISGPALGEIGANAFANAHSGAVAALAATAAILLYAASWLLSVRLYEKREL